MFHPVFSYIPERARPLRPDERSSTLNSGSSRNLYVYKQFCLRRLILHWQNQGDFLAMLGQSFHRRFIVVEMGNRCLLITWTRGLCEVVAILETDDSSDRRTGMIWC